MAEIKSIPDFKCISPKQINLMIFMKQWFWASNVCYDTKDKNLFRCLLCFEV